MGHNNKPGKKGPSQVPSCCNWVWSCCCFHCSGSVYIDNVVVQEPGQNPVIVQYEKAGDGANQNLYGNKLEEENLIDNKSNHIELNNYHSKSKVFEDSYRYSRYRDPYISDTDRDSYGDRMSLAASDQYVEEDQGPHGHLGSYQRIRHMSGLSDGPYQVGFSGVSQYSGFRGDGSINGSFGSPDHSGRYSRYGTLPERYRYADAPERQSAYELRSTLQRGSLGTPPLGGEMGHVRGDILHDRGELVTERDDEEESAYNEHFKNEMGKERNAGEYRIPSVRVRPASQNRDLDPDGRGYDYRESDEFTPRNSITKDSRSINYTGTCSGQNQVFGEAEKCPFMEGRGGTRPPDIDPARSSDHRRVGGGRGDSLASARGGSIVTGGAGVQGDPSLKTVSLERMDRINLEINPPTDRWNLLYWTIVLHGVGTLIPWNIFINAKTVSYPKQTRGEWIFLLQDYFMNYKLGQEYNNLEVVYTSYFLQYITLAAHVPNLVFNWLNVFFHFGGCLTPRIVWSLLVEILVMIVTIVLAMLDTSHYPDTFFYISLLSVVLLNMAGGVYQNTVYGLAGKLPAKYTGAVVLGSNLSGTVVSLINVISIWISPSARTAAIYYFITGLFMLLACFDTYFALPLNRFYRYNELIFQKSVEDKQKTVIYVVSYWSVFKKCFPHLLNIFFTFSITLSLFPAVLSDIDRVYSSFFVSKEYFISIICFLTFNGFAVIGNILPSWLPGPSYRMLLSWVLLRVLFIPFFLLCNYRPGGVERLWPVLFHWDWIYWFGNITFSLSGGIVATLSLMYNTRCVDPEHSGIAGMFGSAAIGSGILAGISFSALMPKLISWRALDWEMPWFWPAYDPTS